MRNRTFYCSPNRAAALAMLIGGAVSGGAVLTLLSSGPGASFWGPLAPALCLAGVVIGLLGLDSYYGAPAKTNVVRRFEGNSAFIGGHHHRQEQATFEHEARLLGVSLEVDGSGCYVQNSTQEAFERWSSARL